MAMAGPFVGVVVDSGLNLGRPRVLVVPMGAVRLPAGVQLVGSLAVGATAVAGECPARGRAGSVLAAAAGNGVSSVVLPVYASSDAGLFFGSAASSAAGSRAAAGRGSQSYGGVVVAATGGSPADGGGVDNDATPEAKEGIIQYQEWLLLPREDGTSKKEMTPMFTKDHVLQLIEEFHPQDVVNETFLVCKEKTLIKFIAKELINGASLLEKCMMVFPPGPKNYEALVTIGKDLKMAATECQRGYLHAETLDRAVVAIQRLRATSLQVPEDSLERFELDLRVRLPERPRPGLALDEQAVIGYFMLMGGYMHSVIEALLNFLHPGTDDC